MKNFLESLKGYRTLSFVVLTFVVAVAGYFGFENFSIPADFAEVYDIALPLVFGLLRLATTTPVKNLFKR